MRVASTVAVKHIWPVMVQRGTEAIACECGRYMDAAPATEAEDDRFGCGSSERCCSSAFVCRVCKKRYACSVEAPECEV